MRIGEFSKKHNITQDTVRHYIDMGLLIPKKEGYHYKFDESHNQDMSKIMDLKKQTKYALELENCSGTFLMQYIEYLPEDTTYIIINKDVVRLEKLKSNLELNNTHERFIFICEEYGKLPIKNNSIDIIIDHWMTKDYYGENKVFIIDMVYNPFKKKGILVGAYPLATNIERDIYLKELKEKGYFNKEILETKYAFKVYPRTMGTFGGVRTDNKFRVLKADGTVINNLYAGGECANRMLYNQVYMTRSSVQFALTSGRIAGEDAAKSIK